MLKNTVTTVGTNNNRNMAREFFKRTAFVFILLLIFTALSVFSFLYKPLQLQLSNSLLDNYVQNSLISYHSFENMVELSEQGAKSVANRSLIRDAMIDYKDGDLTLSELKDYILPKYKDAIEPLNFLVKAERVMDGVVIASVQADHYLDFDCKNETMLTYSDQIERTFCIDNLHTHYELTIPVYYHEQVIGHDHLFFCLSKNIEIFSGDGLCSKVISSDDYQKLVATADSIKAIDSQYVLYGDGTYYHIMKLIDEFYFMTMQDKENLFKIEDQLSHQAIIVGSAIILIDLLLIYYFVGLYAREQITVYKSSTETLSRKLVESSLDPMTKLPLRRYGEDELANAFAEFQVSGQSPAILMFDIDYLKEINDSFGHAIGDQVIAEVAQAVANTVRKEDLLYRWGGDEFIGIINGLKRLHIDFFKNKLTVAVDKVEIMAKDKLIRPRISIGIAYFEKNDYNYHDAVRRADEEMYERKMNRND